MRRKWALLLLFAGAAACGGADVPSTVGKSQTPPAPTAKCQIDDDCDPGDFCVSGECVGDSAGDDTDAGNPAVDAGSDAGPDAGPDAGTDAGAEVDAGQDAGEPDAGTPDAGTPDAGTPDAGTPDAGTPDAGPPPLGHLTVTPSSATAQVTAGQQLGAKSFTVGNDGDASLSWTASCNQGAPSPASGTLAAGHTASVSVTLPLWNTSGTQTVTCTASAGDAGSASWTLTVTVSPVVVVTGVGATGGSVDLLDFVFTGDTRPTSCYDVSSPPSYPAAAFQSIVAQMGKLNPQFALDLGDHQYTCNETLSAARTQMGFYTSAIANAGFKPFWFMTMGNHECGAGSTADCSAHTTDANYTAYKEALNTLSQQTLPYYKVDIQTRLGLARFVFLADNWYDTTAQNWAESTLTDADANAKYTIVIKHHPIAETIGSLRTGPTWSYNLITSGRHKYTLVLTAHAHDYDHPAADYGGRSVICGLGAANSSYTGFCRVQQQADATLKFTAYDAYGNVRTDPSSTFVVTPQ